MHKYVSKKWTTLWEKLLFNSSHSQPLWKAISGPLSHSGKVRTANSANFCNSDHLQGSITRTLQKVSHHTSCYKESWVSLQHHRRAVETVPSLIRAAVERTQQAYTKTNQQEKEIQSNRRQVPKYIMRERTVHLTNWCLYDVAMRVSATNMLLLWYIG